MDVSSTFRRAFHLISPVFMAYYLLPEELGGGITRTSVTLLFLGTAACIEVSRIALGLRTPPTPLAVGQKPSRSPIFFWTHLSSSLVFSSPLGGRGRAWAP